MEVADLGSGRIQVRGALTFATARLARAVGSRLLHKGAGPALEIDCSGVTLSDSAGLAPPALQAVAQISDVEALLIQGITATP